MSKNAKPTIDPKLTQRSSKGAEAVSKELDEIEARLGLARSKPTDSTEDRLRRIQKARGRAA
jgi:hypothetical protein